MTYFVVLATIAWLPLTALSFSFTSEPEQPLVVVLNSNSTNVDFRWEVSLANGDIFGNIKVQRFEKDKGVASFVVLGYYQVGYKNVNTSLYNLDPNVSNGPSSGYVNFTIKDIMKQLNNKDGSKADAQSIDYVYRLVMTMANILEPQGSNVETSILLKVHDFKGPKNVNTTESEQFNVACSADGKPSPNLTLALPNGVEIKGTGSIDVNITAYRIMTGMYNCTAENIVSVPQTKSAWLNVWYSASCTIPPAIATEGDTLTLNISTTGNPSVINYDCTHPNGSVLTGKPPTFKVQREDDGLYNCSVFNGIGERGYCTGKVTVYYIPRAKMACPRFACVDKIINITCEADASPDNITYSLSYGTSVLNHAVNGHVSHNASESGDQKFSCNASNTIGQGATVHCPVKVYGNFNLVCKISGDIMTSKVVNEGQDVTLSCEPSASGSYNTTWKRVNKTSQIVVISDNAELRSLNFSSISRTDDGQYEVTVRDSLGCVFRNKTFDLTVYYKPEATSLTFIPNKTSFCIGREMQINCTSEAKPTAKYSLYRNNQLNPNNSQSTTGMFDVVLNSQGSNTFKCVPSNEVGLGQNTSLNVIVKEPHVIKDCRINGKAALEGNVVNGTDVSLTCNITGSYNLSSARWTKDDREWKGVNITFLALHPYTTGTYYLTVYSGLECNKTVKANLSLTVTFPASCAFPQDVIQVTEGDNVILNVSSTGSPPVNEYIWTHPNGSRLTGNSILRFIASRQDTGTYHCSVYNGIGERGNCTRYVNVTYSAECEIYPNTPTVTVNESDLVDLTCKTNGNPEANDYIWNYPNGSSLPGSSVLSFIASRKDSTSYHCSVSNGVGDRGNCSRQVTVQYRARNVTIISCKDCCCDKNQNSDVTLNCSAEGVPDPTYHWTFSSNDGNVPILETGQSLSIQNLTIEQSGIYTCIASNVLGKSKATKRINVLHKPRQILITRHPEQAVEFRNINLTCENSAYPPPEYEWYFNDTLLDNKTNKVLVLENITMNDAGVYVCFAKNKLGNATYSMNLVVNNNYSAECEIYPNAPTVTVNESDLVNLTCKTNGNPEANDFIWTYPNGSSLPGSSVLSFVASRKDSTSYHCSVSNGVGDRGNCSRHVTVQYKPRQIFITRHPEQAVEFRNIRLTCESSAYPPPEYIWYFNDTRLDNKTNKVLFLENITLNNAGVYVCFAKNELGNATNSTNLVVNYGPSTSRMYCARNVYVNEKDNATFVCNATTVPPSNLTFFLHNSKQKSALSCASLFVNRTHNASVVTCEAVNKFGKAQCNSTLLLTRPLFCRMKIDMVWNATLLDKNSCQFKAWVLVVTQTVKGIYINTTLVSVAVVGFVKGSVIAKVILYFGSNDGSLDLLKEAVRNNITINNSKLLGVEQGFEDLTTTTAPPTAPPTTPSPSDPTLIIVIAVVGGLVILLIVFVLCYCKKKKSNKDGKDDQEVAIAKGDEAAGTNTHPYSPSKYADRGPHTNPGYDSEDGPGSNNNINQSGPTKENEEPAYAAVDMSKKSLKKQKQNHDELTYAELGSFQTSGSQPNGGDIALEHLTKDKHTKMPEKYEETIYAEIIGSKKPGSDNHDGKAATNTPLNELPYKDAEADKDDTADKDAAADKEKDKVGANPSGKTPDPTKQLEQKVVVKEKDPANVPGKPQEQPPTNEDSEKTCGQNLPVDSFLTSGRHDTTLTTVSL